MQQTISTIKGPIQAKISLPGSKSITHRAILLAALANGVSELSGIFLNEETQVLLKALYQLGVVVQIDEKSHTCIVAGCNGKPPRKQASVWCGSVKMIAHFLMTICATSSGVYYFDGTPELRKEPIQSFLNVLRRQGTQFIPGDVNQLPLTLVGSDSLEGGEIILDKDLTSQFISALLIAAPFARSPFIFTLPDRKNHVGIEMTCAMMAEFGVLVHRIHQGQLMVPVPQRYQANDYVIEPDLSIAAYFFAAIAMLGGELTIQAINKETKQTDVRFLSILEKMGCKILEKDNSLTLKSKAELQGIEVSMRDFSTTFLVLAILAPFAQSPTRISHLGPLSLKERQRFALIKNQLMKMSIHVEEGSDWIKIFPGTPQGGMLNIPDVRIAMAFAIMGLKIPGIMVENAETITRIYPDFFVELQKLAQQVDIKA